MLYPIVGVILGATGENCSNISVLLKSVILPYPLKAAKSPDRSDGHMFAYTQ